MTPKNLSVLVELLEECAKECRNAWERLEAAIVESHDCDEIAAFLAEIGNRIEEGQAGEPLDPRPNGVVFFNASSSGTQVRTGELQ